MANWISDQMYVCEKAYTASKGQTQNFELIFFSVNVYAESTSKLQFTPWETNY